jgi:hypothetical protein
MSFRELGEPLRRIRAGSHKSTRNPFWFASGPKQVAQQEGISGGGTSRGWAAKNESTCKVSRNWPGISRNFCRRWACN